MASKKPKETIIQKDVTPGDTQGALQVVKDSLHEKRDRKKYHKNKNKNKKRATSVSDPIPSTSSTIRLISNDNDIVVKTEPDDDIKEEDEGDMYFEIDSATLQNEDLFNQALAQIEEKILIEEDARPDAEHPVRNVVLLVPDVDDDIDIVIKSEPPSPSPDDEENLDAPSTSLNLQRSLRLRRISVCTSTSETTKAKRRKNSSSASSGTRHKSKRKQDRTIANPEPEVLASRSLKFPPALANVKEEVQDEITASENMTLETVTSSTTQNAIPSNISKLRTSVKMGSKYQKHNVCKKVLQRAKLKLMRLQRLHKKCPGPNRQVSKKRASCSDKVSSKIAGESNKFSEFDEHTKVASFHGCKDSRPDSRPAFEKPQTQIMADAELEETSQRESEFNCQSTPCNPDLNIVSEENLLDEMILNGRWSPSSIKVERDEELTLSSLPSNEQTEDNEAELQQPTVNDGNTVDQQCSSKMQLRKNRTPSFKSTTKDDDANETSSSKPFEKRPVGRPRKYPRMDPALKVRKKMGRPKIIRTEDEILEMRRQKNSRRAFRKRMKNQLLHEQKELANNNGSLQKPITRKKSNNEQTKKQKIYKYQHVWRPHPVELYQQAHRNRIVVSSADLMSTHLALSVGHGTFENPHWTLEKDELRCICPGCGETFEHAAELLIHKKKNHADICPSCTICGKPIIRPDCMIRHKKRHLSLDELKICYDDEVEKLGDPPPSRNDRLYQCYICSKILIGWAIMRIHEKIHTEAYSTQCPICLKPIYRKDYLNYHMTTHLGLDEKMQLWKERKAKKAPRVRKKNGTSTIPCDSNKRIKNKVPKPVAMKTFDLRKDDTTTHIHEVKIEVEPEKPKRRRCLGPVDCSICEKTFKTIYVLKKHTLTMHSKCSDENPFRTACSICSRPFERAEYLSKHVQTHMNDKEKQLFSKWTGTWKQFLESLGNGDKLPEPSKHRGRPKKQTQVVKVAKKKGRPRKNLQCT